MLMKSEWTSRRTTAVQKPVYLGILQPLCLIGMCCGLNLLRDNVKYIFFSDWWLIQSVSKCISLNVSQTEWKETMIDKVMSRGWEWGGNPKI